MQKCGPTNFILTLHACSLYSFTNEPCLGHFIATQITKAFWFTLKYSGALFTACLDTKYDLQAPMHPVDHMIYIIRTTCANSTENSLLLHFACTAAGSQKKLCSDP